MSFFSDDILAAAMHLSENGLVVQDDGEFVDAAIVDELSGPTIPCSWLEWTRGPKGMTRAWLSGQPQGRLTTPEGFKPARLTKTDLRDEEFMLPLGEEKGVESWLNTKTGDVLTEATGQSPRFEGPIMKVVRRVLEDRDCAYTMHGPRVLKTLVQTGCVMSELEVRVQEDLKSIRCRGVLPFFVPLARREAVRRLIDALNANHYYAAHELDVETGRVSNWFSVDLAGGYTANLMGEILDETVTLSERATAEVLHETRNWINTRLMSPKT